MSSFIALLSPAKLIDDQTHYPNLPCTEIDFGEEANFLVSKLRKFKPKELAELMSMSDALAAETYARYQSWELPFSHKNAHPALLMFKGEVYRGLQAQELNSKQFDFAQKHIRILSGLYGILRPLDLVMPYRLMMGTRLAVDKKNDSLYTYWKSAIYEHLHRDLDKKGVIIDLASNEYFKAVDAAALQRRVINCEFKEKKAGKIVTVNTYAKSARGKMARFIIDHKITKASDLKAFDYDSYAYAPDHSQEDTWVFTR